MDPPADLPPPHRRGCAVRRRGHWTMRERWNETANNCRDLASPPFRRVLSRDALSLEPRHQPGCAAGFVTPCSAFDPAFHSPESIPPAPTFQHLILPSHVCSVDLCVAVSPVIARFLSLLLNVSDHQMHAITKCTVAKNQPPEQEIKYLLTTWLNNHEI
ncbi:hypothetical protein B0J12DRAFT_58438 [Macrophomina phaseolina]|uniref:Uncharacterized protein n=1 Tax=Macrophomina phaseolina TaxID=35725 RepID=A0ABQ8GEX8_9PEZI|nr:hypothetical protein B0J12DRAFT_58438 [Macrophomina phaseolina]